MGKRGPTPGYAKRAEVLSLRATGLNLRQIAGKLGITYQRVQQILLVAMDAKLANAKVSPPRKTQMRHALTRRCQGCGKKRMAIAKGSKTLCADCRKAHNAITREKKKALVEAGLCVSCGRKRDRTGRLCDQCLQQYNRRYR
jgi:predicted amidophosphoribosyltransferase